MKFFDFEYDGIKLSGKGFMLCSFGNGGLETISLGSEITFNTVNMRHGLRQDLTSISYDSALQATLQICKNSCNNKTDFEISDTEIADLSRWLNRKEFLKFKPIRTDADVLNIYYEASFNVSKVKFGDKTVGLELNLTTNRPHGLYEFKTKTFTGKTFTFTDVSDEIGYIYPKTTITVKENGDLSIYNSIEDRTMEIKNCKKNEVITLDYPMISSSLDSHKLQDDFNWSFLRIANTFTDRENNITSSLSCEIKIDYSPIAKVGI